MSNLLLELLKEIRDTQKEHGNHIVEIKNDVRINTEDLTEHKEGVMTARKLIEQNEKKFTKLYAENKAEIDELKRPKELRKMIFNFIVDTAKLAGSLTAVYGLYKLFL